MNSAINGTRWKKQLRQGISLRLLILKVLESIYHENTTYTAYDIQNKIYKLTYSFWKPSPGSIYPILEELSQKGFVSVENRENKDHYALTTNGKEIFHQILALKLIIHVVMHTRLYDTFNPTSIQLPTKNFQFTQQFQQMASMVGTFAEQEGINLERIREYLSGIELEIQKEAIRDFIKGIDNYTQLLTIFKEKLKQELETPPLV